MSYFFPTFCLGIAHRISSTAVPSSHHQTRQGPRGVAPCAGLGATTLNPYALQANKQTDRDRQRQTETDRDRQTDTDRQTEQTGTVETDRMS